LDAVLSLLPLLPPWLRPSFEAPPRLCYDPWHSSTSCSSQFHGRWLPSASCRRAWSASSITCCVQYDARGVHLTVTVISTVAYMSHSSSYAIHVSRHRHIAISPTSTPPSALTSVSFLPLSPLSAPAAHSPRPSSLGPLTSTCPRQRRRRPPEQPGPRRPSLPALCGRHLATLRPYPSLARCPVLSTTSRACGFRRRPNTRLGLYQTLPGSHLIRKRLQFLQPLSPV
jgi:hypothetical protein